MSRIYTSIVNAVENGSLNEPFSVTDFRRTCRGFAYNTYTTFLAKHRKGNPGNYSEMFIRVSEGVYKLKRPFLRSRTIV
jgi:hypothetical protein